MTQRTADEVKRDIARLENRISRTGDFAEKCALRDKTFTRRVELIKIERTQDERAG